MTNWNFADAYEVVAANLPDAPCQVQGDRRISWSEFDSRANGLAADLLGAGLGHQSKVAAYLYNGPEFLEAYVGAFKAGMVPVNTNYRYGTDEIAYLFDDADVEAVVFHAQFTGVVDGVRPRLPGVRRWYLVGPGEVPDWAVSYEEVVGAGHGQAVRGPWGRSGDDLVLLYTGGTTGLPKGVMWRQDDLFNVLGAGGVAVLGQTPCADMDELAARVTSPGFTLLPACPLMHGTGQLTAWVALNGAGCIVTLEGRRFDAAELWRTVEAKAVNVVTIVGDAFARPMLAELAAHPGTYDLSSLVLIASSGVMWSRPLKAALLETLPNVILYDTLSSSEAVGLGESTSTGADTSATARFSLGERVHVLSGDGQPVEPGSDQIGEVAISGFLPLGYYKDPQRTAATFRTVGGTRYSVPGDFAGVEADGTLRLLGRGSGVVNTGGEKVFPEEVEEVVKAHPGVADAVCIGIPDERFGEAVAVLVEPLAGAKVEPDGVIAAVRSQLASFKVPRRVLVVASIGRSPTGKVDYPALAALALESLGTG